MQQTNNPNTPPKVAIYCRLSEEDRNKQNETDDSNSIQNQKTMLLQHSMVQGWDVFNIYSDDDYAGADRRRPEFNRLLQDAKEHKFDIVLCKTQSRFTRELELVEKYIHGLFPLWGIRFVSIVDNADTANKGNKKSRQINGLVNEWYLEDMSENIRSVLTNRRQNGHHIGSFALYGYKKDPEQKGHLIIDEEAASVVREVFTLFAQGYGKTAIARILNDRGVPNPTEYKRLQGLRYKGPKTRNSTLWKYYAISDMLVNEIYIGNMVQGKYGSISYKTKQNKPRPKSQWYIVEGTHEPIIDQELWERVQALIAKKTKPFDTGQLGLFAGKVRCAHCGYVMRSQKKKEYRYLQCQTKYASHDACIGSFISQRELEKRLVSEINRFSAAFMDQDRLESQIEFCTDLKARRKEIERTISIYERRIAEISKHLKSLYSDKLKGIISEDEYIEFSADFRRDRERLSQLVSSSSNEISTIDERIRTGDDRKAIIASYKNIDHLTREIIDTLIDHIVVYKKDPDTKQVSIEIHWNI